MKFSEAVAAQKAADDQVSADRAKLATDQATAGTTKGVVLQAIHAKGGTVALPMPDGSVQVFKANDDLTDYAVETIPGDFDIEAAPAA